jgi:hypothetical protein
MDTTSTPVGGTLPVRLVVVNTGRRPLTLAGSGSCTFRVEVRDAGGAPRPAPDDVTCTRDCRAFRFEPGRPVTRVLHVRTRPWSRRAQAEVPLAPGTYSAVGIVDGEIDDCGGPAVRRASSPVRFVVTP